MPHFIPYNPNKALERAGAANQLRKWQMDIGLVRPITQPDTQASLFRALEQRTLATTPLYQRDPSPKP